MQSEKITPDNVAGLEWDEEHFKYCTFSGLEMEGHTICSDFVGCTFENVYWYWVYFPKRTSLHATSMNARSPAQLFQAPDSLTAN